SVQVDGVAAAEVGVRKAAGVGDGVATGVHGCAVGMFGGHDGLVRGGQRVAGAPQIDRAAGAVHDCRGVGVEQHLVGGDVAIDGEIGRASCREEAEIAVRVVRVDGVAGEKGGVG